MSCVTPRLLIGGTGDRGAVAGVEIGTSVRAVAVVDAGVVRAGVDDADKNDVDGLDDSDTVDGVATADEAVVDDEDSRLLVAAAGIKVCRIWRSLVRLRCDRVRVFGCIFSGPVFGARSRCQSGPVVPRALFLFCLPVCLSHRHRVWFVSSARAHTDNDTPIPRINHGSPRYAMIPRGRPRGR